jgi:hypothetical protein
VIIFGVSEGAGDLAVKLGFRHVEAVATNEQGTPLISSLFAEAERLSSSPMLCYVNADIIILPDLFEVVDRVRRRRAMTVGRRTNIDITTPIDFDGADWAIALRRDLAAPGQLNRASGVDHFLFLRGLLGPLPPMALGRYIWDKWRMFHGRRRGAELIGATEVMTAVHQNHGYAHMSQLEAEPTAQTDAARITELVPEARQNFELTGGWDCLLGVADATHRLTKEGMERVPMPLRRRLRRMPWVYRGGRPKRSFAPCANLPAARGREVVYAAAGRQ